MRTLLIDTAGPVVGLAAFVDGAVVWAGEERVVSGAEAWLAWALDEALPRVGRLDRVGVVVGPGAFTGLRVGVATGLGLAFSVGASVAPLSSLALRACLAPGEARVLALLDARKGRVYAGWFDTRGDVPVALSAEVDASPAVAVAGDAGLAVGEGIAACGPALSEAGHRVVPDASRSPVRAAGRLVEGASTLPPESVGLRYLREPDARPTPR